MNRQKLLLSVLLALFAVALAYSFWRMPRQETVTTLKFAPGAKAKGKTGKGSEPVRLDDKKVRLDLLSRTTGQFSGFRRNIFQPLFQEKKIVRSIHRARMAKPFPKPAPSRVMLPPEPSPIQRDMAQFTFLGFLKKENRRTIFLTSNNEIFLVKKGDSIAGKYVVANITDEMLAIRSQENGGEIIIPLIENRPLQASGQ
jgi:hypothetical protein